MLNLPLLKRLDVETPLGVVHLVAFKKTGVNHRLVILDELSDVAGCSLSLEDIVQSDAYPRPQISKLDFDVNWTHSGDICVLAYGEPGSKNNGGQTKGLRVGVDYEVHKAKRLHIAEHFFSSEEAARIASLAPELAVPEFFRLWCRKEALYKCVGGTFFEGSIRRSVLDTELLLDQNRMVYFSDVDEPLDGPEASLCIAVSEYVDE